MLVPVVGVADAVNCVGELTVDPALGEVIVTLPVVVGGGPGEVPETLMVSPRR